MTLKFSLPRRSLICRISKERVMLSVRLQGLSARRLSAEERLYFHHRGHAEVVVAWGDIFRQELHAHNVH